VPHLEYDDSAWPLVRVINRGVLGAAELELSRGAWENWLARREAMVLLTELHHPVGFKIDPAAARAAAGWQESLHEGMRRWVRGHALWVSEEVLHARYARVFEGEAHAARAGFPSRVFRDISEAEAWLRGCLAA